MTHPPVVGRPVRVHSQRRPALVAVREARRPAVICWPAVALAAGAGSLLMVGVTVCIAVFQPRAPKANQAAPFASVEPSVSDARAFIPTDLAAADPQPKESMDSPTAFAPAAAKPEAPPPAARLAPPPAIDAAAEIDAPRLVPDRRAAAPAPTPLLAAAAPMCQTFGTSVRFAVSPTVAEKQAAKEDKLVFLLHVSGDFEDDAFT